MAAPGVRRLVTKLLDDHELEPAAWSQGSRPTGHAKVTEIGVTVAPRVREYAIAAEREPFRRAVAAIISADGGFYWSVWPVLVPRALPAKLGRSTLVTLLAGCVPIAIDPDSGAFLIVDWRTSMVASFLFDDVVESDPEPGDFVVEAMTLDGYLRNPSKRPRASAPTRKLERLYRRGIWLAHLLCEYDIDPELGRILVTARDAAPIAVYREERKRFPTHPHLAMYWLLALGVLAADQLEDALDATKKTKHPAVVALRARLAAGHDLLAHRKKTWPANERDTALAAIRDRVL